MNKFQFRSVYKLAYSITQLEALLMSLSKEGFEIKAADKDYIYLQKLNN